MCYTLCLVWFNFNASLLLKCFLWILTFRPPGPGFGVCRQNICYKVAAFVIRFNLICNSYEKSWILTFDPHGRGGGGGLRAKYLLPCCSWFHLIWFASWPCSKKVAFLSFDPKGRGRGLRANYLIPCCCMCDSIKFDMQYDHVLKKVKVLSFYLTP